MNDYILETRGLSKTYKNGAKELQVLKDINLKIKAGEFFSIQGPSGAGKSTLLHILGSIDYPTLGSVIFNGQEINRLPDARRAYLRNSSIGFVFQFFHLLPEFTAMENVLLPAYIKNFFKKKEIMQRAKSIFEDVGLSDRMQHRPGQLSGGEQQRVCIVRALINEPRMLLCDEPTGNLDSQNGAKICQLLKELNTNKKITILVVTHDDSVSSIAQKVIHLRDGMMVN